MSPRPALQITTLTDGASFGTAREHTGVPTDPPHRPAPRLVSVVVPARNAAATIVGQLDALGAQTYGGPWEILVVDNGSDDGTAEVVRAWGGRRPDGGRCRLLEAPGGVGAGYARNRGIDATAGDLVAFCDSDDRVTPRWLEGLVAAARTADAVVGVSSFRELNPVWLADGRDAPARRGTGRPNPPPLFGVVTDGNNLAVWRDALEAVGGFDEAYLGGSEDKDLGYRLRGAGWRVVSTPDAVVEIRLRRRWSDRVRQAYARGREDVRLFVRFESAGYPRRGVRAGLRNLAGLAADLRGCRDPAQRVWWWHRAARAAGRVRGSVRHRRLYL
jgi:glycosyltransferase involved in cell wall biosynthesis